MKNTDWIMPKSPGSGGSYTRNQMPLAMSRVKDSRKNKKEQEWLCYVSDDTAIKKADDGKIALVGWRQSGV